MNKIFGYILAGLVFLFPLFFLPTTQEFYITNKFYLLGFGALVVLLLGTVNLFLSKKINWKKGPLDTSVLLLVLTVALSVIITSPNKIAGLLNLNYGLIGVLALTILFFAISQINHRVKLSDYLNALTLSAVILAVVSIFFFIQPFRNAALPTNLQYLKSPNFSPMGGVLDLIIFLGFVGSLLVGRLLDKKESKVNPFYLGSFVVIVLALVLSLYSVIKPLTQGSAFVLPPYRLSWYAAIETLKSPLTALFGVGVDNFASIFTKVKDVAYNQSQLWQVSSFSISRSALLHVLTVTGVFGLLALLLSLLYSFRLLLQKGESQDKKTLLIGFGFVVVALVFTSPSLPLLFAFFLMLAFINKASIEESRSEASYLPLGGLVPVYAAILLVSLAFVGGSSYFLGRAYASEFYFKKSLDGFNARNGAVLYNNQRKAIQLNPYNEIYRVSFSETNMLIANSIAARARQSQSDPSKPVSLNDKDKQSVTQAIQAAIDEAKAAVALNPQKSVYWESLARTYRGILNIVQSADVWTLTSYQRAIGLDPKNPVYYLDLGGVFYGAKNYNQASQLFSQAVLLKPDWPNAHYNLAWSLYQQQDYQTAANQMQAVMKLLEKNKNSADYKKAQKEFEEFKKKIPPADNTQGPQGQNLKLPAQPQPALSPKLELPKNSEPPKTASQEAK